MKIFQLKYILTVLITTSSSFCAYFPITTDYIRSFTNVNKDYQDWLGVADAILWTPNFIFFMPIIFGFLADTIGVLSMLLPLQLLLLAGQLMLTISSYYNTNQELTALIGLFFISFSYKGIELGQTLFLVNTFVRVNKDTKIYQKLALLANCINFFLINFMLFWLPPGSGEIVGCCLCLLGIGITAVLSQAPWAQHNVEEIVSNAQIVTPLNNSSTERIDETYSTFNKRDASLEPKPEEPIGLTPIVVFLMIGYACAGYFFETLAKYYLNAFEFSGESSESALDWLNLIIFILVLSSYLICLIFYLSEKLLGKLIIVSCSLLFLSIMLSFTKVFAGIIFWVSLTMNPGLPLLYLPFLAQMRFKRLGLFVGCYAWIEISVHIIAFGYGSIVGSDGKTYADDLRAFSWTGSNFYRYIAVPYMIAMAGGLALYVIRKTNTPGKEDKPQDIPEMTERNPGFEEEEKNDLSHNGETDPENNSMVIYSSDKRDNN